MEKIGKFDMHMQFFHFSGERFDSENLDKENYSKEYVEWLENSYLEMSNDIQQMKSDMDSVKKSLQECNERLFYKNNKRESF